MSSDHHPDIAGKHWPIVGSFGLFFMALGIIIWLHGNSVGSYSLLLGGLIISYMIWGWFSDVIRENRGVLKNDPLTEISFRWGIFWFIFTEIMLFVTLFGALFYARLLSVPWLGGEGSGAITHLLLWPDFHNFWPVFHTPSPDKFIGPHMVPSAWRIPALNTLCLFASDVAVTWAYWAVLNGYKRQLIAGQLIAVFLCAMFVLLQISEYMHAYQELGLTLGAGIYGSTFFFLTGIHGLHVVMGIIILSVLLARTFKGHFTKNNHFAIAAASWYWHFIDFLWIAVFVCVYWL